MALANATKNDAGLEPASTPLNSQNKRYSYS